MKMFSGLMPSSQRLLARGLELLALAEIGGEGHHLAAIGGLQPFQDDRGVEPAGIGEHHLFHVAFGHGRGRRFARKAFKSRADYRRNALPRKGGIKAFRGETARGRDGAHGIDGVIGRQRDAFDRPFHRLVGKSRRPPAVDQAVHQPDDQEREHAGEDESVKKCAPNANRSRLTPAAKTSAAP